MPGQTTITPGGSPLMHARNAGKTYDFSALSVLVVDDSEHMLAIVRRLLVAMRIESIREAHEVEGALNAMRAAMPDLVILDWNMIPLDGLDFLERVRKGADSPNKEIPILMLTAHTEMHRVIAARDAGVNWVVAKPISFKSLYEALAIIVESERAFVHSDVYVGPDRRTRRADGIAEERRQSRPDGPRRNDTPETT
jgi:two-component system chemotaxis response regulator CheY